MKKLLMNATTVALAISAMLAGAQPEAPMREMRGIWLTTVLGLDFPDGVGSDPAAQRAKLDDLLDLSAGAGINTIILQVRSECDALYPSEIEPWSREIAGQQGRAPTRAWDPLQYTIDECRRRGMELHVWLNPYRAGVSTSRSFHSDHPLFDRPDIVERFDAGNSSYYWLNPGNPDTIEYNLEVIRDIVTRYDIDGIHFDDYFYPYEVSNSFPFPDSDEFAQYGGGMSLDDWRRNNVNQFVEAVHYLLRSEPGAEHVRYGISPFGIWRSESTGGPEGIFGLQSYYDIWADSRLWLQEGWLDYMMPQLYWGRAADGFPREQDYDTLHDWWASPQQNPLDRLIVPGLPAYKVISNDYRAEHIVNMIEYTQQDSRSDGNLIFRTENLTVQNSGEQRLNTQMANGPYAEKSIQPLADWLNVPAPSAPLVSFEGSIESGFIGRWDPAAGGYPQWYVTAWERAGQWSYDVLPGWQRSYPLPGAGGSAPDRFAVAAMGRAGHLSDFTVTDLSGAPTPGGPSNTILADFDSVGLNFYTTSPSNDLVETENDLSTTSESNNRLDPEIAVKGRTSRFAAFEWTSGSGGVYRLSTFGDNPQIDLNQGFGFYVKLLEGEVNIALAIRETGGSGPIGADGGATGALELTGNVRITASPNWQYVYFEPMEDVTRLITGDGMLDGDWGVFESLWITQAETSSTRDMQLYLDDFHQGDPHTMLGEPLRPRRLESAPAPGAISLAWNCPAQRDFATYRVYRSTVPGFTPGPETLLTETASTAISDLAVSQGTTYHYRITTVDAFGYESFPSAEITGEPGPDVTPTPTPSPSPSPTPLPTATPQAGDSFMVY